MILEIDPEKVAKLVVKKIFKQFSERPKTEPANIHSTEKDLLEQLIVKAIVEEYE